jgi:nucleotide-binding universal stress UspA family protein
VAGRPWPRGSEIEVLTVISTRLPEWPDGLLMLEAAHIEALEAERVKAPLRVARAEAALSRIPGVTVRARTVEAAPAEAILEEAQTLGADLIVLGSHGYGPVAHLALGSVSEAVAHKARCSVEIVRCPGHELPRMDPLAAPQAQSSMPVH